MCDQASRDVGADPVAAVDPMRAGTADVAFIAGIVPNIMDGAGLMGHDDHTVGETANLTTLPRKQSAQPYLLYRLHTHTHANDTTGCAPAPARRLEDSKARSYLCFLRPKRFVASRLRVFAPARSANR